MDAAKVGRRNHTDEKAEAMFLHKIISVSLNKHSVLTAGPILLIMFLQAFHILKNWQSVFFFLEANILVNT